MTPKYPAKLNIILAGGAQHAWFIDVEAAKTVLHNFSHQLAKIKEFSNRDEDPIFQFEAAGAFYSCDLRKAGAASVELRPEFSEVTQDDALYLLRSRNMTREAAATAGLSDELEVSGFDSRPNRRHD